MEFPFVRKVTANSVIWTTFSLPITQTCEKKAKKKNQFFCKPWKATRENFTTLSGVLFCRKIRRVAQSQLHLTAVSDTKWEKEVDVWQTKRFCEIHIEGKPEMFLRDLQLLLRYVCTLPPSGMIHNADCSLLPKIKYRRNFYVIFTLL